MARSGKFVAFLRIAHVFHRFVEYLQTLVEHLRLDHAGPQVPVGMDDEERRLDIGHMRQWRVGIQILTYLFLPGIPSVMGGHQAIECLSLYTARRIRSQDVLDQLFDLFISRGLPEHIRSDNGPEFTAKAVRKWLAELGVTTLFIEPGSPWENGYVESFNGKLRDELLNGEIFDTLLEARVLLERWRREYNCYRPHSSLQYRPPAPEAFRPNILSLKVLH